MSRVWAIRVLSLLILWFGGCVTVDQRRPPPTADWLTIRDVGEYGGVPWGAPGSPIAPGSRADRVKDLNLAVSSINLGDDLSPAFLEHWAAAARWGKQQGKAFLPRVYFWDGNDRFEGALRAPDVYWRRLDRFLSAMDLKDFYGICLAEENITYAGRPAILDELYHRLKAKYDLRVYQWLDNAVPDGSLDADGWIVDPYNLGGQTFRRFIQRYLLTGKPVVVMPWASWYQGEDPWTPDMWRRLEDQLQVCREYNLPTAFYWVSGFKGQLVGGVGFGLGPGFMGRINQRIFDWIKEVRALPPNYDGLASADLSTGDVLDLGPNPSGELDYRDSFQTTRFVEDADLDGFRDLLWGQDRTLALRSWNGRAPRAAIVYQFAGDFPARNPAASVTVPFLAPGSRVTLSISRDGKTWRHAVATKGQQPQTLQLATAGDRRFADLRAFRVRVELTGRWRDGQTVAKIAAVDIHSPLALPTEPAVTLQSDTRHPGWLGYADDFQTCRYRFTTTRTQDDRLEWSRGQIAVRMRPNGANPTLIWKVKTGQPVREIQVEVAGRANSRSLDTNLFLDLSADGTTWSHEVNTRAMPADASGWTGQPLTIHLAADRTFTSAQEFYVRLRLQAPAYDKIHPYLSGIVTNLRIAARPTG